VSAPSFKVAAAHCNTQQHAAEHCNTQRVDTRSHGSHVISAPSFKVAATHYNTLQNTATNYNTHCVSTHDHMGVMSSLLLHSRSLQHNATHCNTLQHTATHCNTLRVDTSPHGSHVVSAFPVCRWYVLAPHSLVLHTQYMAHI